jgi:DNA-binding response OmpR family regulator
VSVNHPEADECPICLQRHRDEIRGSVRPARVLVAEDEPCVANLIAYNLEQEGYRVSIAQDGVGALRALREAPPDLLVLDLLLPQRSGWQVLRTLRSQPKPLCDLPVLIVSALACDRLKKQLSSSGVERVLGKPFSVQELREIVRDLLDTRPTPERPLA